MAGCEVTRYTLHVSEFCFHPFCKHCFFYFELSLVPRPDPNEEWGYFELYYELWLCFRLNFKVTRQFSHNSSILVVYV